MILPIRQAYLVAINGVDIQAQQEPVKVIKNNKDTVSISAAAKLMSRKDTQ